MKIAVTGATGFLGQHVLRALASEPAIQVVTTSRSALHDGHDGTAVRHVRLDLGQPRANDFEALGRPDVLVHLAWEGLPNYRSPHHFETELPRQYEFLRQLICDGLPALVCVGSCFEYGMKSGLLDEEMTPDPQNPYGFAKDALRRQLVFLKAVKSFRLTWARLFYTYGEGQSPQSLYSQVLAAIGRGDASFGMSGGEQLRDYLPVAEVAANLVALAARAPDAGVVNVCSGQPVSVRSLVERWLSEHGSDMALQRGVYPYPDFEPLAFWGSRHRLDTILDRSSDVTPQRSRPSTPA